MNDTKKIGAVVAALVVCPYLISQASTTMAQDAAEPDGETAAESDTGGEPEAPTDGESPADQPEPEPESPAAAEPGQTSESAAAAEPEAETKTKTEPEPETESEETAPAKPPAEKPESSWTDRIKLKGDLRYRFETIDQEEKTFRSRHRIRARAGIHATVVADLDVVLKLGTGGADDPVSNNQTMTKAFSSKPIWLDMAYFDWHPGCIGGLDLVGGKMKNPFYRTGKSELLWDPDLNPEGLALRFKREFGMVEPFVNGGAFWVRENKEDDDSWFYGVQGGLKLSFAEGVFYVLAGGGYVNHQKVRGQVTFWDSMDGFGNTVIGVDADADGEPEALVYSSDFNLVDGFLELGGKIGSLPWSVFGDIVVNTGADVKTTGWLAGALLGKTKQPLDFYFRYIYREVMADAAVGVLTDSDFIGGGTDGKGHEWNLSFVAAQNVTLAFTYFYNQTPFEDGVDYQRSQTDLKLKF